MMGWQSLFRVIAAVTCVMLVGVGYLALFHQITISTMKRCVIDQDGTDPHVTPIASLRQPQLELSVVFSSGVLSPMVMFSSNVSKYTLTLPATDVAQPYVMLHVARTPQATLHFTMATAAGTLSTLTSGCGSGFSARTGACFPPASSSPGPFYDIWKAGQQPPPHARSAIHQRWLPQVPPSLSSAAPFNESFPNLFLFDFPVGRQFMDKSQQWQHQHGVGSSSGSASRDVVYSSYVLSVGPGVSTLLMTVNHFNVHGAAARSGSRSPSPSPLSSTTTYTITIIKHGVKHRWVPRQPGVLFNNEQQALIDSIPSQFASRSYEQPKALIQSCHTSSNNHATIHIHDGKIYVAPERVLGGHYYRVHSVISLLYSMMDLGVGLVPSRTMFLLDQNDVPSFKVHDKPQCEPIQILAFTTNHKVKHHIIPIPDFSFWAHVGVYSNWNESRRQFYNMSWCVPSVSDRSHRLFFRGVRLNSRVEVMDEMNRRGHDFGATNDKDYKSLKRQCRDYRYLVYMGGWDRLAWSTRLKYQLLCGSAVVADRVHTDYAYTEFWNKLLIPYTHFVPVTLDNIMQQHALLESNVVLSSVIGMAGRSLIWDVLTYEFVLEYMSAVLHELTRHVNVSTLTDPGADGTQPEGNPDLTLHLYPRQSTPMTPVTNMKDMLPD